MKKIKRSILFICTIFILLTSKALAAKPPTVKRLKGKNRVETSIEISKEAFKSSKDVIIVGYRGEVDALTGTILAEEKDAPILISDKKNISDALKNELNRLGCQQVFILGGSSAVDDQIEKDIKKLGLKVKRIKGDSREQTAINIAQESIEAEVSSAFLSLGYGVYADALAIGPVAAKLNIPLLLTKTDKIGEDTMDYIDSSGIDTITIVGGESAVGVKVENTLKSKGIKVKRIKGDSREETAVKIAERFIDNPKKIFVANGYKYPDAVAGGYLAAKESSPILLSKDDKLKDINKEYIEEKKKDTIVLGGSTSIDESVFNDIELGLDIIQDFAPSVGVETDEVVDPVTPSPIVPSNFNQLKEKMTKEFEEFKDEVKIKYQGDINSEDIKGLIRDIYNDGSYIGGAISSVSHRIVKEDDYTHISFFLKYRNSLQQENFIDAQVNRILKDIIRPGMSEFEKVKAVHDYLVNNTTYSKDTNHTPHSAYTIFKEGKGVCQGYSLATNKLLQALDIESYYVIGKSWNKKDWGSHSWNLVKIDGNYYNMDVTKDDPLVKNGNHILDYKYFLVSDKKFSKTHIPNRNTFPKANDPKYEVLNGISDPFEYKGSLYFGNKDDGEKLYSISLKNLKLRKLSNERAPYLVIHDDTIYFSNYSQGGYLYKSDLNGKNSVRINKVHSTNLQLKYPNIVFFNKATNRLDSINISK